MNKVSYQLSNRVYGYGKLTDHPTGLKATCTKTKVEKKEILPGEYGDRNFEWKND